MDVGTVSSDDVITSYKQQLSDAHHQIAVLTAQLFKAGRLYAESGQQVVTDPGGTE